MKKSLLTICLAVVICIGMLLTNGCALGITAAGGTGEAGAREAANMLAGKGSGDHGTNPKPASPYYKHDDTAAGLFRGARRGR